MTGLYLDSGDDIERRNEKLTKIVNALMRRVEQAMDDSGEAYQYFQRSLMLEEQVRERTLALEDALDQAERANSSRSRFVAAASHDLLQPLSAAKLFLALLQGMKMGEEQAMIVQRTLNALSSVESILSSLLEISKLDSGQASVAVSTFPMSEFLDGLYEEFEPIARHKGLDLRKVGCDAVVESDPSYLRRILQNLIGNAIRYTDQGKVLFGARRRDQALVIQVWDTGLGISVEDQEIIFREFHRLSHSEAGNVGVGLGLTIVERACALLGHTIEVSSEVNKGSVFSVTVPIRKAVFGRDSLISHPLPSSAVDPGLLAIVIENNQRLRSAIVSILEGWGVTVFEAAGYKETVEILPALEEEPNFIMADYQLDETETGLDAIALIRGQFPGAPALLITAEQDPSLPTLCQKSEVQLMRKPIDPEELKVYLAGLAS